MPSKRSFFLSAVIILLCFFVIKIGSDKFRKGDDKLGHFIGMCFGMNVLSNLYYEYKLKRLKDLKEKIELDTEQLKTFEVTDPETYKAVEGDYIGLMGQLKKTESASNNTQNLLCDLCSVLSISAALICLAVAYYGWYFNWNMLLAFPAPIYYGLAITIHRDSLSSLQKTEVEITAFFKLVRTAKMIAKSSQNPTPSNMASSSRVLTESDIRSLQTL